MYAPSDILPGESCLLVGLAFEPDGLDLERVGRRFFEGPCKLSVEATRFISVRDGIAARDCVLY